MGDVLPEGVSRQEFSELAGAVREVREALDELREASTAREKDEARDNVRDAKADLTMVARELGLDPKRLQAAAEEAKLKDERERLRPILVELLDEELAPPEGDGDGDGDPVGEVKDALPKPEPKAEPKPEPNQEEDSGPSFSHWSERPLSALFGGGEKK